jgi:condensin complex subunit 1
VSGLPVVIPVKLTLSRDEDDMDVDEVPTEEERDTDDDVDMEDGDATPKPKSKRDKPTKRRKSELNMEALTSEQAALAALDGNEMLSLKLRKKYYSEALNFIHQIESAIPIAGQLLGSTHKSEVLEAMEFFRIIHEYKFEGAEVRIAYSSPRHSYQTDRFLGRNQENASSHLG